MGYQVGCELTSAAVHFPHRLPPTAEVHRIQSRPFGRIDGPMSNERSESLSPLSAVACFSAGDAGNVAAAGAAGAVSAGAETKAGAGGASTADSDADGRAVGCSGGASGNSAMALAADAGPITASGTCGDAVGTPADAVPSIAATASLSGMTVLAASGTCAVVGGALFAREADISTGTSSVGDPKGESVALACAAATESFAGVAGLAAAGSLCRGTSLTAGGTGACGVDNAAA